MSSRGNGHVVKMLTLNDLKQVSGGFGAVSESLEITSNGKKLRVRPSISLSVTNR